MRTTYLKQTTIAAATIALLLGAAGCTGDEDAEPTLEPAPAGGVSDSGGAEPSEEQPGDETVKAAPGECAAPEGTAELPKEAPPVDSWEVVGQTSAPQSTAYGPFEQEGELWTCYEHSAAGALFAATYVFAAMGQVEGFADAWVPAGEFHDLVAEQEAADAPAMSGTLTPAAYRYIAYSGDSAVIDLVNEFANAEGSAYLSMRFAVSWDGDRWTVDVERSSKEPTPIENLDGYVRWE